MEEKIYQCEFLLEGNGRLKQQLEQKIHESEAQMKENAQLRGKMEEKIYQCESLLEENGRLHQQIEERIR